MRTDGQPSEAQTREILDIADATRVAVLEASTLRVALVGILIVVEETLLRFGVSEEQIERAVDGFRGIAEHDKPRKAAS